MTVPLPLRPQDWTITSHILSPRLGLHPERAFNIADLAGKVIDGTYHYIKINRLQKYNELQNGQITFEEAVFAEPIENLSNSKLRPNPEWFKFYGDISNGPWQIGDTAWKVHNGRYYYTDLVTMTRYDELQKGSISLEDAMDAEPIANFHDSLMPHEPNRVVESSEAKHVFKSINGTSHIMKIDDLRYKYELLNGDMTLEEVLNVEPDENFQDTGDVVCCTKASVI